MADFDSASPGPSSMRLQAFSTVELDRAHLAAHNIVGLDNADSRSRAFNLLRTRFATVLAQTGSRLVGITSATPEAGKSFLAVNLALSLAKVADNPVFLVDLDLRRGSVADELGLEFSQGVGDFLAGEVSNVRDIGLRVDGLPLVVFPTQRVSTDSAELLSGPTFDDLMRYFHEQTDRATVIFDLPPAFASDDAMISVKALDGYVLVVDSRQTSKAHVLDTMALFEPVRCLGTILNRYIGGMSDQYGYGYGANYSQYYK